MTDAQIEVLCDAILRAAGSGLKHYTPYTRAKIIEAAREAIKASR
jgi:hypothetical protein